MLLRDEVADDNTADITGLLAVGRLETVSVRNTLVRGNLFLFEA